MPQRPIRNPGPTTFLYFLAGTLVAAGGLVVWGMPPGPALIVTVNAVTFVLFGWDKRMASRSGSRIPETCLLGLAFVGGSPASLFGQVVFRHKRRKTSFRQISWGIVAFQILVLLAYTSIRA